MACPLPQKDWATLLHYCYYSYLLLVTNYLAIKLPATDNISVCRNYLAENRLSFPSAPCLVGHSYLLKGQRLIPYTCGSTTTTLTNSTTWPWFLPSLDRPPQHWSPGKTKNINMKSGGHSTGSRNLYSSSLIRANLTCLLAWYSSHRRH